MKSLYNNINFEAFSDVPENRLTKDEQSRILNHFFKEEKKNRKRSGMYRAAGIAVCLCLAACFLATPLGGSVMAAAKQAFLGVGQFLGVEQEDDYATVINETQTKGNITLTLNEVLASDHDFRFSVTAKNADGTVIGLKNIEYQKLWINGQEMGEEIESIGTGPFGIKETGAKGEGIYFLSVDYINYEMPLRPDIRLEVNAGDEVFTFDFVLENAAFKRATKTVDIHQSITVGGKEMLVDQLIISPIDQYITLENPQDFDSEDCLRIALCGTDDQGREVVFYGTFENTFRGSLANDMEVSYQLNPNVKSYTLHPEYDITPQKEDPPLKGEITIHIP